MSRATGAARVASSSSEPPQRTRVTVIGSPGVTAVQLATIGRSRRAAAWARTSWPRSVPVASTAAGASSPTAAATTAPHASGP